MNDKLRDALFVIGVFGLVYIVLVQDVSISGYAISLPDLNAEPAKQEYFGEFDHLNYYADLNDYANIDFTGLQEGNDIYFRDGQNTYSLTILHVVQNRGDEYASLLITPGNKRLRLKEGGESSIDFNNDGDFDVLLSLESVESGKVNINVRSS